MTGPSYNAALLIVAVFAAGAPGPAMAFPPDGTPPAGSPPGASPQRWVLQDAGSNCRRSTKPGALQYFGDSVVNDQGVNVVVFCPVNLGGQFDGFDSPTSATEATEVGKQVVFHHATVPAARSTITVTNADPARSVSCTAVAATGNGNTWMSRTVGVAGSSVATPSKTVLTQTINLAPLGNWGGQLGVARRQLPIRSLSYTCTLPSGTGIQRYVTAVCQNNADCHAGDDTYVHGQAPLLGRVQHNGTECVAHDSHNSASAASLIYSENGIRFAPSSLDGNEFAQVACPLGAATGDSRMAPATFKRVDVFMTGPRAPASAPPCRVLTLDDRNTEVDFIGSEEFKFDAAKSMWSWSGRRRVDRRTHDEGWPSLYLNCFLVPGSGILGTVTTQDLGGRGMGKPNPPTQPPTTDEASW